MGVLLIWTGLTILLLGCVIYFYDEIPFLGKLPGDIILRKENFTLYFPLASTLLLSILISIVIYVLRRLG